MRDEDVRLPDPPDDRVDVSVVIPALNVASTIGAQLEALASQDYPGSWEVIVADNGSTDGTRSVVTSFGDRLPQLRVVDALERQGVNHARNRGAQAAAGNLLLFCDGDDVVSGHWVGGMVNALTTFDAVGGRLTRTGDGRNRPRSVDPVKPDSTFLPHPIGANCGVRRSIWIELGGFDESYDGKSADEVEFFWRLQLIGYRLGSAPDAIIHYRVSEKPSLLKSYRIGREQVRLYRDFRASGHPGPSVSPVKAWGWLLVSAPKAALSAHHRDRWLRVAARRLGHMAGSVRYRHVML